MSGPIWKRPSAYVALCAVGVISLFVARGDLRVETDASRRAEVRPEIVHNNLPAPQRREERAVLTGRVLDALGFAVPGAEVADVGGRSTRTGPDGTFELAVAKALWTDLMIAAKGFSAGALRTSAAAPGPLVVQLEPASPWADAKPELPPDPALTGEGMVRDREGNPVTGAYVTAAGSGVWSRTDEIGRYVLPLLDAAATLVVHRPATDEQPALAARSERLAFGRSRGVVPLPEIVVDECGTIHGILRGADGSPLVGVPVLVEGAGVRRVCESGIGGHFQVDGLLAGDYRVRPLAWRGELGRFAMVTLERDRAVCDLQLASVETRKVQVCEEGGAPVANAYVASVAEGLRRSLARADEDGWAEVRTMDDGMGYEVRAAESFAKLAVQRLDDVSGRLVVAVP